MQSTWDPLLLFHDTGSPQAMAWAIAGGKLIELATVPAAGWLTDRFDPYRVMLASSAGGVVLSGTVGGLIAANAPGAMGYLIGAQLGQAVVDRILASSGGQYLRSVTAPGEEKQANSLLVGANMIPGLVGGSLAPMLGNLLDATPYLMNGASYLAYWRLLGRSPATAAPRGGQAATPYREALAALRADPYLFRATLGILPWSVGSALVRLGLIDVVTHAGLSGVEQGMLLSANGIGSATAWVTQKRWLDRLDLRRVYPLSMSLWAALAAELLFTSDPVVLASTFAVQGAANFALNVRQNFEVTQAVPTTVRGRVGAISALLASGGAMAGSTAGGLLLGLGRDDIAGPALGVLVANALLTYRLAKRYPSVPEEASPAPAEPSPPDPAPGAPALREPAPNSAVLSAPRTDPLPLAGLEPGRTLLDGLDPREFIRDRRMERMARDPAVFFARTPGGRFPDPAARRIDDLPSPDGKVRRPLGLGPGTVKPGPPPQRSKRMLQVVPPYYDVPAIDYGGIESVAEGLANGFVGDGHEVLMLGAGRDGTRAEFRSLWAETQWSRLGEADPELQHAAKVRRAVERLVAAGRRFDLVHDHTMSGPLNARFFARELGIPTFVTVHNLVDPHRSNYYRDLGADLHLVAISDRQRALNPDLDWAGRVYNGLRVEDWPFRTEKERYVAWLGRYSAGKGPATVLRAAHAAGLPAILAGKCTEPGEIRYRTDEVYPLVGPQDRVLDTLGTAAKQELLARAGCAVFPAGIEDPEWEEPFGLTVIEAMACGTPVVVSDKGALPELVIDGVTGRIVHSADEIPEAIREVLTYDPSACRAHVAETFGVDRMVAGYERIFRNVMNW
ncbi:MFS transporter [Nocardia stercoris]|nr:MFS transporter [Nocardia stercoris]